MQNATCFSKKINIQLLNGIFFVILFASSVWQVSQLPFFIALGISPLIVGILLGMVFGNTLKKSMPTYWAPGISFSTKTLLRFAIILYGFRLTFQDLYAVGVDGFALSIAVLGSTFILGSWLGIKVFKLPQRLTFLTVAGSSVCGAAAVLATEPVVKGKTYESSIAVGTVVVFGTVAMFVYPFLYNNDILEMTVNQYGAFVGATLHEVAHVVAAGQAISPEASNTAIIVKMMRVIMIAPLLIAVSVWLKTFPDRSICQEEENECIDGTPVVGKYTFKTFPWFAVLFVVTVGINSLQIIPAHIVHAINVFDIFLLTMSMCALGMETSIEKIRMVGPKPFLLAGILAVWLMVGGYFMTKLFMA